MLSKLSRPSGRFQSLTARASVPWAVTGSGLPQTHAGSSISHGGQRGFISDREFIKERSGRGGSRGLGRGGRGGARGGGPIRSRVAVHDLSAEEMERIRDQSDIRDRLRAWESENHIPAKRLLSDVPTRDIPLSNYLTRPDMLPGSTEAINGQHTDFDDNKSQANRALYDGDELEDLRGSTSALVAGDLVETRYGSGRLPILAICLGNHHGLKYFYMSTGEVVPEQNIPTLFTLTNFVNPSSFRHITDILPSKPVSNPRNVLSHRKNIDALETATRLQEILTTFHNNSISFYQAHDKLDLASTSLALPDKPDYLSLEEIAAKLLPEYIKVKSKFPPHALYAVHCALQRDEWGFRPLNLRWHRRNYIYEVRPASDSRILRRTEVQVRELIEGAALREKPAESLTLLKQNSLGQFILKARGVIEASRQRREWTPHGMIGPSTTLADNVMSWSNRDLDYIRFMELWACHRIVPKASQLETLGSTILRLTNCYTQDEWLAHWTAFTFLQEIGWIPPWEIPARYEYRFPDTTVQRGTPIQMPLVDVNASLRPDIAAGNRRDWGDTTVFCVDAESTTDVDDGFSVESTNTAGVYWIHVHIADPASTIDPDSDVARRIQQAPSSLYLPGFPNKMLPRELEQQFSLDPGQPTLTFSAKVNDQGQILDHKVEPGIIKNVLHVPKDEVAAVLPGLLTRQPSTAPFSVGTPPPPSTPSKQITKASALSQTDRDNLLLLNRLCKALKHQREKKGQLPPFQARFNSPEVSLAPTSAYGDPNIPGSSIIWVGDPFIRFSDHATTEADRLVERLMHTAGEVAARFCSERKIPIPYSTQPEALRNRSELAAFRRQHIDPLTLKGKPIPVETLHALFALVGTSELAIDPAPFYSVGLDAYARSSSPLRRYADLVVHWQIHAALARERATAASLAGTDCSEADFLPWRRSTLAPALPMLQAQQRQIKQVDNKDGPTQWIAQALLRAWRFGEAPLPATFTFVVDGLYAFGLRGRLASFYNLSASIDLAQLSGFAKMADIKVDDLIEVEIKDVNVVTTQISVKPLRRLTPSPSQKQQPGTTGAAAARVAV